jgi:hypothetical protein
MLYNLNFFLFSPKITQQEEKKWKGKKQKHTFTTLDCNKTPNKEKKWKGKQRGTNVWCVIYQQEVR